MLAAPGKFLVQELHFKRLVFIFRSFVKVFKVDLLDEFFDEVFVKVLTKLFCELKYKVKLATFKNLTFASSILAEARAFLLLMLFIKNLISQTIAYA